MPLYEYLCENGHRLEILQKLGEKPIEKCTVCDHRVDKIISKFNNPRGAGMWLFDRGGRDLLHK